MAKINNDLKDLVIARIEAYSNDVGLIIGADKHYSKSELVDNVKNETELGRQIIGIQLEYLQDIIKGNIYTALDQ